MIEAYEGPETSNQTQEWASRLRAGSDDRLSQLISLSWLRNELWRGKLLIGTAAIVGLLCGIVDAHISGNSYLTQVTLMPAESDADRVGGLGQVTNLFGGGADVPLSKFKQFQVALASVGVASLMDQRYATLCEISPNCDPVTKQWQPRSGLRATVAPFARNILGMPQKTSDQPTIVDFVIYIRGAVAVDLARNNVLTLSIRSSDPSFGPRLLSRLIETTNDYIKARDRESLRQYVAYLSDRLANLDIVSQRDSLQGLLLEQSRRLMLTEVGVPYAAAILDPPTAALESPIPRVLAWFFVGIGAGLAIVVIRIAFPYRMGRKNMRPTAKPLR